MANFNTHLSVAAAGSCCATVVCTSYFNLNILDAFILLVLGTIAGLLPDIDSDHSTPAKWLFRFVMLGGCLLVVVFTYQRVPPLYVLAYVLAAALVMHFILFKLFKKVTSHRGLFHSVPAALLFGLVTHALGMHVLAWSLSFSSLAASFVAGGYLLHLLLDEVFSVDLAGGRLKKSFGSALTLITSKAWGSYCMLYALIIVGVFLLPMPEPFTAWIDIAKGFVSV
ncbi:MAG: metal-dependent hydrolase [Mariprofundaceae bacterium]|nr:metal-dependent hydrolase [Mariprofundaceae bacterium]